MSFYKILQEKFTWERIKDFIYSRESIHVENALSKPEKSAEDFATLLSPAAENFLEEMASTASKITRQRFGKTIKLYAPIYLSNECTNSCVYCGFNRKNDIERKTLSYSEIEKEATIISSQGIRHILLVSGESPNVVNMEYLKEAVNICRKYFSSISIEIYPLSEENYYELYKEGVDGLTIYQETYNEKTYSQVHPAGKKRNYLWRLESPERGANAGIRTIGIGALMGLEDFRTEEFFVGMHADYLMKNYWKTHFTISFPRIRKAAGNFTPHQFISDKNLVQCMLALRIFKNDAGLVISTRESSEFRDNILPLGVTQMSAGSKTEPGGYHNEKHTGEQFEVEDDRSVAEFVQSLKDKGFDPVNKDWDRAFLNTAS
ncbi:2-iminoacetate synthase ThiH [Flexistipes sinusarabici]|uniref:2-iminoacetate synthase ThiH n=1 Tax=Flexistipes sinusarabici TaxID=2352 RepID=UPI002356C49D|nr:2-iminoacetate synthase ThiH [Flexistipes sinusarabici]